MNNRLAVLGTLTFVCLAYRPQTHAGDVSFFRVHSNTTNTAVITQLDPNDGTLSWSNGLVEGDCQLERNDDLRGTAWVQYVHSRFAVTGRHGRVTAERPAPVARTGWTNSLRSCDDGYYRSGGPWPTPRFSIQADSETVMDNLTGLVWTRNANPGTNTMTWSNAVIYCDDLVAAGCTDWRLPNLREVESLIDYSRDSPPLPAGHPFTNMAAPIYWTATAAKWKPGGQAYGINISGTGEWGVRELSDTWYVWPVRGGDTERVRPKHRRPVPVTGQTNSVHNADDGHHGRGIKRPVPRFTPGIGESSNCVRDNLTGLMWLRTPDSILRALPDGIAYCESLDGSQGRGGHTDWRLPNVRELLSLVDWATESRYQQGNPFTWQENSASWMSSTPKAASPVVSWKVFLQQGYIEPALNEGSNGSIWPVRNDLR
jgi:hypothetical protein